MKLAVIIPAAGGSTRFNAADDAQGDIQPDALLAGRSKLDEDLGGRSVLQRTVELFSTRPETIAIIVAGPHDPDAMASFSLRHADTLALLGAKLIPGGKRERYETVQAVLSHIPAEATHIAVHDGARPACPERLIDRVLETALRHSAVIPAIPADATVKRLGDEVADDHADPLDAILGAAPSAPIRLVADTLDRAGLVLVQTPQVFERSLLERAYAQPDLTSTDDAGLVERLGEPVVVVEGDPRNIKITRPADLEMIRLVTGWKGRPDRPSLHKF